MQIGVLLPPLVSICCLQGFVQVIGRFLAVICSCGGRRRFAEGELQIGVLLPAFVSISVCKDFVKVLGRFLAESWRLSALRFVLVGFGNHKKCGFGITDREFCRQRSLALVCKVVQRPSRNEHVFFRPTRRSLEHNTKGPSSK